MLAEPDHGLARRVAVVEPGRLVEAVVDPAPEAQLVRASRPGSGSRAAAAARATSRVPHGGSTGSGRLPSRPITSDSASTPSAATLKTPGSSVERGVLERVDDVVLVHELEPRDRSRAPSAPAAGENIRVKAVSHVGAEHVGAAQHGDGHLRVLLRRTRRPPPRPRRCRARARSAAACGRRIASVKKAGSSCSEP